MYGLGFLSFCFRNGLQRRKKQIYKSEGYFNVLDKISWYRHSKILLNRTDNS